MNRTILSAHAALFGVALFYALNYFIAKSVFAEISPLGIVALRSVFGIVCFGLIHRLYIRERIKARKDFYLLAICGLLGASLNQQFFLGGLERTLEVNAAVLMTTTPIFVFLTGFLLRTEKLSAGKIIGLMIAFVGASLLTLGGRELNFASETMVGDLMVAFNAAVYGIYLVIVRPLMLRYHVLTIMFWVFVFGGVVNIPLGLPDLLALSPTELSVNALAGMAYILVFSTLLAYLFNAYALQKVNSSAVGIYIYLQPVLVAIFAWLLDKDPLNGEKSFYMLLVLLGVFVVSTPTSTWRLRKRP